MPKRGGAKVSGCEGELIAPQFVARKNRHAGIGARKIASRILGRVHSKLIDYLLLPWC